MLFMSCNVLERRSHKFHEGLKLQSLASVNMAFLGTHR
jgi:hypothetical protein